MEFLPTVILSLYLFNKFIDISITFVNLNHLKREGGKVPAGFEDQVSGAELAKMRSYTLAQARAGLVSEAAQMAVTIVFVFGPLLNWYNSWLVGLGLAPVPAGMLFFMLLFLAESLLNIPFGLYHTFVIEERFGFNKQTPGLWISDFLKSQGVSMLLVAILLGAAFGLIQASPAYWWLFTWLFFFAFSIFMLYLSPYVIEPLFNKFTPLQDEQLAARITTVLDRAGIAVSRIFTMDASKRSGHGNAYFSGIGRVKRIVLFDTLLAANNQEEIVGILAHEVGHWKKKHVLKRIVVMELSALVGLYLVHWLVRGDMLVGFFGLALDTMPAKLLLAGFLGSLASFWLQPFSNYLSRRHEWQADAFAVRLTGAPQHLASALVKLGRDNLANLHPHPWYAAIHYSHPPLVQRVGRLLGRT